MSVNSTFKERRNICKRKEEIKKEIAKAVPEEGEGV